MSVKNKYYKKIQGWFNFEEPYEKIVNELSDGTAIAEIGSWRGTSTCFLATYIYEQGKSIIVHAIDTWAGSQEDIHKHIIGQMGGPDALYNDFLTNIRLCGVNRIVNPIRLPSVEAANIFDDKSIEFVYIDAGHTYDEVLMDIRTWLPKANYAIAGHDYHPDSQSVVRAVHDFFDNSKITVFSEARTWWVYL